MKVLSVKGSKIAEAKLENQNEFRRFIIVDPIWKESKSFLSWKNERSTEDFILEFISHPIGNNNIVIKENEKQYFKIEKCFYENDFLNSSVLFCKHIEEMDIKNIRSYIIDNYL